jgi:hypothetical protein
LRGIFIRAGKPGLCSAKPKQGAFPMSIATPSLTNFTAGEISPRLYGRVDLAKYFNGCSRLENMIVHPHGGATRRSGLRFIAEAAGSTGASLLIPFEFNAEQTYLLELAESGGRGVLRVFKDRGQVLGEDGEPVEVESPYMGAELSRLRHVQSNDTLILTHPEHPPRTLTRLDHHEWVFAEIEFTSPPEQWAEGNQPTLACFFEDRLVLAATPQQPSTLWFSRTKEYYDFRTRTREVPLEDWGDWLIRDVSNEVRDGRTGDKFLLLDGDSFESDCVVKGATAGGEKRYYRYTGVKVLVASGEDLEVVFADTPGTSQIESVHDAGGSLRADCWEEYTLGQRIKAPDGGEPLDEDAFELTLSASQANVIEFLVPRSRLWVGTMSARLGQGQPRGHGRSRAGAARPGGRVHAVHPAGRTQAAGDGLPGRVGRLRIHGRDPARRAHHRPGPRGPGVCPGARLRGLRPALGRRAPGAHLPAGPGGPRLEPDHHVRRSGGHGLRVRLRNPPGPALGRCPARSER